MLRITHISTKWVYIFISPYVLSLIFGIYCENNPECSSEGFWSNVAVIILLISIIISSAIYCWVSLKISKKFGYGWLYGLGLVVFPYICWPVLGFGKSRFVE